MKVVNVSTGDFDVALVGESNYQGAIRQAIGLAGGDVIPVNVMHEPDNKFDASAVKVTGAGGKTLGYLPRDMASEYAPALRRIQAAGGTVVCEGRVAGGTRDKPSYGVWIDLPSVEQIEVPTEKGAGAIPIGRPAMRAAPQKMSGQKALGIGCLVLFAVIVLIIIASALSSN